MKKLSFFTFVLILFFQLMGAQIPGKNWSKIAGYEDENFLKSSEAKRIAGNVLLYQKNKLVRRKRFWSGQWIRKNREIPNGAACAGKHWFDQNQIDISLNKNLKNTASKTVFFFI